MRMWQWLLALLLVLATAVACAGQPFEDTPPPAPPTVEQPEDPPQDPPQDPPPSQPPEEEPDPPHETTTQTVNYLPDWENFPNPERGFHDEIELAVNRTVHVGTETTLVRSYVRLDDYRTRDLPQDLLNDLQLGFDAVRNAGLKVIPRFTYNWGTDDEASLAQALRHIDQLTPLLRRNADVIAVLQAGFIGRWGEWHGAESQLTDRASKRRIAEALLQALPPERMLQIRAPFHIRHVLDSDALFEPARAFTPDNQARIGLVNDCFLAGSDDVGTFPRDSDVAYTHALTPFTVTGGETCSHPAYGERQECPNALQELADFNWDYLNSGYYAGVLNKWRTGGCFAEIERRLGYRFELLQSELETSPGAQPVLRLKVQNSGFGKLYNPRPLQLILTNAETGEQRTETIAPDARLALPLAGEQTTIPFYLPADLPAGSWQLGIALPDGSASLAANPAYSIRFAALDELTGSPLWNSSTGVNSLGLTLQLD